MLERSAVKVASYVLMGEGDREVPDLPDWMVAKHDMGRSYSICWYYKYSVRCLGQLFRNFMEF